MRVAASSPAWLTRRALSRNCCCSALRAPWRFALVRELRDDGEGSVEGGEEEVVIEAFRTLKGVWEKQGRRNSRMGVSVRRTGLEAARRAAAAFMVIMSLTLYEVIGGRGVLSSTRAIQWIFFQWVPWLIYSLSSSTLPLRLKQ